MEFNNNNDSKGFAAARYVKTLLTEGDKVTCDDTNKEFDRNNKLPPFYDEDLFNRGKTFFYDNLFAVFYSMMLGLLAILAVPSVRRILIVTRMSGDELSSYRRYLATLFHVKIWYDEDPKQSPRFWKSLNTIKSMHNAGSKLGSKAGLNRISQKDMALTQLSFMGFVITRPYFLGIHYATESDFKAFIHFWRVIGYLLGVEDRFNICRESAKETQEIANLLFDQVIHAEIQKKDKDFLSLSYYFLKGIWVVAPYFQFKSILCILDNLTKNDSDLSKPSYYELNWFQRLHYWVFVNHGYPMKLNLFKVYTNLHFSLSLWLMRWFPFIAYYYYGIKNATVNVCV